MKTGNKSTIDRITLRTKKHILAIKEGITLSTDDITSPNTHDTKVVTKVIDYIVLKRPAS